MKLKSLFYRRVLAILTCLVIIVCLPACSFDKSASYNVNDNEVLTQKKVAKGKIPITILVKYAFSINQFEQIVEEKFPNIDIIQVGNFTGDRGLLEYERRLQHDDLTDIVMTWPLDVGEKYLPDRLLDLSTYEFSSNYHNSMLEKIVKNGRLYYLPGPAQVRGIVYNKTLFAENNWQVPQNFDEFVELCRKIEAKGIRSLQLGFKNSEVLDTAFVGFNYGNTFSKPQDSQWLNKYDQHQGSIADQFSAAIDNFQYMIDQGVFKKSDLDIDYAQREQMLFSRKCAMIEDSVLMARMGNRLTGSTDEFALMPFFNPKKGGSWARLYMICYIGVNKHLAEPQHKEKYKAVMELLEYISTPEGQAALASDTGAMYSSVNNVASPNIPEIQALLPTLQNGRYAIFPELKNAQPTLRSGLIGMLQNTISKNELVAMVDRANRLPAAKDNENIIGMTTDDFTLIQTGSFVTDTMRQAAKADVALFMDNGKDGKYNGKGISGRLYKGQQSVGDILRILPDLKHGEKGIMQIITMKGQDLISTLEYSIPVDNNIVGWFYYFSGLKMTFDPTAPAGSRIYAISDIAGNRIDPNKIYSIAVMDMTVPDKYVISCQNTDITIKNILVDAFAKQMTISPADDNRFVIFKQ